MADRPLKVDGGEPPRTDDDAEHGPGPELEHGAPAVPHGPELGAEPDPGWSLDTVENLIGAMFLPLHFLTVRRGGPPDAWQPDDAERGEIARPLHAILQRSVRARAVGKFGDGIAVVTATGAYVASEADRVARYQTAHAADEPPPDADVDGLVVGADRPGEQPRRWRPPTVPAE